MFLLSHSHLSICQSKEGSLAPTRCCPHRDGPPCSALPTSASQQGLQRCHQRPHTASAPGHTRCTSQGRERS